MARLSAFFTIPLSSPLCSFDITNGSSVEYLLPLLFTAAQQSAHTRVIVCSSGVGPEELDLDIIAIQVMLLTGALLSFQVVQSRTLQKFHARSIVFLWTCWLLIGVFITLFSWSNADPWDGTLKSKPACRNRSNSQGIMLRSPAELGTGNFDCTWACFSSR